MKLALSWTLLTALLVYLGAHLAIAIGFARRRAWGRVVLALFVPPLAPMLGWREGMRARVYTWVTALTLYAIGVAVA